jgi:hypothetical protein
VITTAGVTFLRDDWNANAQDYTTFNFHGIGTGTNAEAVGDTALQTESTTALNPDNTRATGTRSTPSATVWRSVGTLTADCGLCDRLHRARDLESGSDRRRDALGSLRLFRGEPGQRRFLQATYDCTLSAGG